MNHELNFLGVLLVIVMIALVLVAVIPTKTRAKAPEWAFARLVRRTNQKGRR